MTYGELKNFVLKLLNRYSVGGEKVGLSYNDQADIVARMPELVIDGMLYLASSGCRQRRVAKLTAPDRQGDFLVYQLPDDCRQLCGGLLRLTAGGDRTRYSGYRLVGDRQVAVPIGEHGPFLAEYFRYPQLPSLQPEEGDFLDCPPEAQMALAYYVASHLAMEDNNYLHAALHNEFELRMIRLQEMLPAEQAVVEDVYG